MTVMTARPGVEYRTLACIGFFQGLFCYRSTSQVYPWIVVIATRSGVLPGDLCQGVITHEGRLSMFRIDGFDAFDGTFDLVYIINWFASVTRNRSAGPMARRLTTNQEIAGSIPASIKISSSSRNHLFC